MLLIKWLTKVYHFQKSDSDFRDRIQEAINEGDKGAFRYIGKLNRAVKNKNWTYARRISGITIKPAQL